MIDLYVYQVKLPAGINEMVTPGAEDDYTIYINSELPPQKKLDAYRHAVNHCKRNDFGGYDVQIIEKEAHSGRED
ncbi:MAG: hypothetical protein IKF39_01050 [Oscillospiraceae bacterium]|nr:hypothetical protein [Oscillospiraceae bacterium]MBR3517576.1 hypothetical protein [Lachnospiraceae bacterium]